ncbi:hypothetical protein ALC57_03085 [Trachymyrmex cornetzi]|uniref:Uncharacterized protein n=1 Tax=Trachymyrmex cornetzi TaxID=471704 RepID=A0A151JMH8_9HYME|nr:hypothetical protein ALC57_03085 [Trachymyrmex cornetzi]
MACSRETRVKLSKTDLPGAYEDWYYSYKDTFEKLIYLNEGLTAIEKFYYLRSSLKDGDDDVIKSIETTTDNYNEAWATVKQRFDHERWLIQKHVKALFETAAIRMKSHVMIRELVDTILKHLRALKALKRPTDTWDDLVIHLIVSKLDVATSKAWELSIKEGDIPDFKELINFLIRRCQALESEHCRTNNNSASSVTQKHSSNAKTTAVANVATSNLSCSICKETHSIYHCKDFLNMSIKDRIKAIKKAHLCINCLRSATHQAKVCNSGTCRKCHKKHNTLLHISAFNNSEQSASSVQAQTRASEPPLPVTTQCTSSHRSLNVLLSTAIVNIYDSDKQMHSC